MLNIGIIGCGKIADIHAAQIQRISGCDIVGVCDSELLMARQLGERFNVRNCFSDVNRMLEVTKPDIVHITTPPQSHFMLGKLCLEAGSHVYIEKPFTLNTKEAKELIQLANEKKLKLTVGHNRQFSHVARRMRELVRDGYLGGDPVHMESVYCYNFRNAQSANELLGDKNHWIRKLPGKLLHNMISHGVCRIAEFLQSDSPTVVAQGFRSPFLVKRNETSIIDELRVIIYDNNYSSAYFTFSSQIGPGQILFRVYGPKNSIIVDDVHQTILKVNNKNYKSYLEHFIPPFLYGGQYIVNALHNVRQFLKRDFHMEAGMKNLIESFYLSVLEDKPLPISYREILLTSKIMDTIFQQIFGRQRMRDEQYSDISLFSGNY